jgi:hypothetical protein
MSGAHGRPEVGETFFNFSPFSFRVWGRFNFAAKFRQSAAGKRERTPSA